MQVTGSVLGALIAGLIGLLTQFLAIRFRAVKQKKQWKDRLVRLSERLNVDRVEEDDSSIGVDDEVKLALHTFLQVQPLLEDHLANSPDSVPEDVFEHYENIVWYKKHYGARSHAFQNGRGKHVNEISGEAQAILDSMERWNPRYLTLGLFPKGGLSIPRAYQR